MEGVKQCVHGGENHLKSVIECNALHVHVQRSRSMYICMYHHVYHGNLEHFDCSLRSVFCRKRNAEDISTASRTAALHAALPLHAGLPMVKSPRRCLMMASKQSHYSLCSCCRQHSR
jgi:hypothetical protein